ncbi:MAG: DUF1460 domain-containing protein [Nitrospirae bacterium]|nr:DUF1460 domain-containing protein [Nitrospirota bacterium]
MQIIWGNWTEAKLNHILKEFSGISEAGSRINFISEKFLNTAYRESTLTGDADTPESLVINLEAVDCFTFIDYVEAMRQSGSFHEFIENLEKVRYNSGKAAFENRNHFFTDWREFNSDCVDDITGHVGLKKTRSITKILNLKTDGTCFLKGIQPKERVIKYIASTDVNHSVIEDLKTGDYAGIS